MKRFIVTCLILWAQMACAVVSTQVSPARIQLGDTFQLTFILDNTHALNTPDLTPLQQNFKLMGTQRSMTYSVINGQAQSVTRLVLLLSPKKAGTLEIPAIKIAAEQSEVAHIEVLPGDVAVDEERSPDDLSKNEISLSNEVSERHPYLNQQIIYSVKLFNRQRLMDAEFQPPSVEDALLIALGDGRRFQTEIDGKTYAVEELQYAIFPQKTGPLKILPPRFNALVYDSVPKRIQLKGKLLTLDVKPIPQKNKPTHWLPAKQIQLIETYDTDKVSMKAGNTLVRTITIKATGLPTQLLPTIELPPISGVSIYPDKMQTQNTNSQQELVGIATIKATYLFHEAGKITIPELRIPWFNTVTGKEEIATLPPHIMSIEPDEEALVKEPPKSSPITSTGAVTSNHSVKTQTLEKNNFFANWLAIGLGLAWGITLILWWLKESRAHITSHANKRRALRRLKKACFRNDPGEARQAVLHWASIRWPDQMILNLNDVQRLIHEPLFKRQLHILSETLYRPHPQTPWNGKALWECIAHYRAKYQRKRTNRNDLPPMNP